MVGAALLVAVNALLGLAPLLLALTGSSCLGGVGLLLALVSSGLVGAPLVAGMYAFNRLLAGHDTGVFRDFVRGYRENFLPALAVWLPYLVVLAVLAYNLYFLPGGLDTSDPLAAVARVGLIGLSLLVLSAGVTGLLLLSRFTFRVRDLLRLSLYCLGAQKRVSLGNAGILFVSGFLLLFTTAFLLLFIAGLVVYLICLNSRPLLKFMEEEFTAAA